jgi:proteasome assembly chaperone (PAC2) family protein
VTGNVDHVRWDHRPDLRRPVLLAAFEGWNDAGSAATTALGLLGEYWDAEPFATIDPEEFVDFSEARPTVQFDEAGQREIIWPETQLSWARVRDDLDVVMLVGVEPHLRWRTFCQQVTGIAADLDVRLVVVLGALLAEVPHTRPTPVYGTAYDPDLAMELSLTPSSYEGPTGIVGVLHDVFRQADLPSASLWAAVPTYVPNAPSPKAALALAARLATLLDVDVPADELSMAAAEYEQRIDEVLADDEDSADYVTQLEQAFDEQELDRSADLVAEVERFLRRQS